MKFYGPLEKAQAENLAADPTPGVKGRFFINATDNLLKVDDGTVIRTLLTKDNIQIITNKDIDGGVASNSNRFTLPGAAKATLDGLTRKAGTILYATDLTSAYIDNGSTLLPIGAGGGSGQIKWLSTGEKAPTESTQDGMEFFDFDYREDQEIYTILTVPETYIAGTQIKILYGAFYGNAASGNVLFKAQTSLLEDDSTVLGTYTNQHTSTNTEKTLSVANRQTGVGTIDLTDSSGLINSIPVAPGDKLLVKLYRNIAGETSTATVLAQLLKHSMQSKFTA